MKASDVLTREEIAELTQRSDWKGAQLVAINWALIALAFAVAGWWTNPLTLVFALFLLGGRQLGLGVLMHECGHNTLFATPALNRFCGRWLAAFPVFSSMETYAKGHLEHHKLAGTENDPDLPNYQAYPVPAASLRRKLVRDLTGQTGIKFFGYVLHNKRDAITRSSRDGGTQRNALIANGILLAVLTALGKPWLYLLWFGAFMTTYFFFLRIRQIGEHANVPNLLDPDPRNNTRTVIARWWEKLFVAPVHVHYHLEHHILASVPAYNLAKMHALLEARGVYDKVDFPVGYVRLLKSVVKPA